MTDDSLSPAVRPRTMLIEGWRGISHSFGLVNQAQVLELMKIDGLELFHRDLPYAFDHWSRDRMPAGLPPEDQARLDALPLPPDESAVDCVYRIGAPTRSPAPDDRRKTLTFMTTELGLTGQSFAGGRADPGPFTRGDRSVVTTSTWAKARLVDWGLPDDRVAIVPHGVDTAAFHPLSPAERDANRAALGFGPDETVFLNVGLPVWNKGVDLLVLAFATLRSQGRKVRLVLKDQANVYGRSARALVGELAAKHPAVAREDTLGAISVLAGGLSRAELRVLYGVADCYVSPYRAEGFNLPVLEAIGCGTPVIVTRGGATDDFCTDAVAVRIDGKPARIDDPATGLKGRYIEPDLPALTEAMDGFARGCPLDRAGAEQARGLITETFTWARAARLLHDLAATPVAEAAKDRPLTLRSEIEVLAQKDILDLIAMIRPVSMTEVSKVRVGNDWDGGYVLPETALHCDAVLSIGVGPDVSFDMAFAERGARIMQFDHTVEQAPSAHENFSFYRMGWGPETTDTLLSFPDIMARFGALSPRRALLKFDIEGYEYPVLEAIEAEDLRQFEVIVCEFHHLNRLADLGFYKTAKACFEKLLRFHALVHLHANNCGGLSVVGGVPMANVMEFSFLRRDLDSFTGPSPDPIPGPLDRPNHPMAVDICLNAF